MRAGRQSDQLHGLPREWRAPGHGRRRRSDSSLLRCRRPVRNLVPKPTNDPDSLLSLCREQRALYSKKYGVDLVRFTHHANTVLCASKNSWDDSLRYLSLHDNRYLRYFKGHRDRVVSLAVAPSADHFLSASLDETVRVWDLRSPQCSGVMRLPRLSRPAVAYDPQGLIFGVAAGNNTVKLLDARAFDRGPFATFQVPHTRTFQKPGSIQM